MNLEIVTSLMSMEIYAATILISTMFIVVIGCLWLYFSSTKIVKKINSRK